MAKRIEEFAEIEKSLQSRISTDSFSESDQLKLGFDLSALLFLVLNTVDACSSMSHWVIDDMYPSTATNSKRKATFSGQIHWLSGGNDIVMFQFDVAKDTTPLLYSFKLSSKRGHQRLYIGKTFDGWVVNGH